MNKIYKVIFVLLLCAAVPPYSYAIDSKDSAKIALLKIDQAFEKGKLSGRKYLDTVHAAMRALNAMGVHFKQKELLGLLDRYKKVIWSDPAFEDQKRTYYAIFSNQAQMAGRNGEMLYYAEKIGKLEQELTDKHSVTALTIEMGYYNDQNSFHKTRELFLGAKHEIAELLNRAVKDSTKAADLAQLSTLLSHAAKAAYTLKDTLLGHEVEQYLDMAGNIVRKLYPSDLEASSFIRLNKTLALNYKAKELADNKLQEAVFRMMEAMLLDEQVPDYLKDYIYFNIVDRKVAYFLKQKVNDSAAIYLAALEKMRKDDGSAYNKFAVGQFKAKYLFNLGKYKESADTLGNAVQYLDSTHTQLVKDINEMMYAQAKAEEQQLMLNEAAVENKRKEQLIWSVSLGALFLVILGIGIFLYIRQRQKRKFLEFKLNMARNIHDETGPALLYAKSLAKSCKVIGEDEHMRAELESHIENMMFVIRSLSHDLKSDELHSIGSLVKETETTLKKLKALNVFNYEIKEQLKENRFISHYQYSQLKAVLQECITNSIKHATFDQVDISFTEAGNKLTIQYSDNGAGWQTGASSAPGIGLNNMKERVRLVNGEFSIESHHPDGYAIQIVVPLR